MKKERYSFFILFVEIAAIVFLHSAKSRRVLSNKQLSQKEAVSSSYTLKGFTLTKIK